MSKIVIPKNAVCEGVDKNGNIVYNFEHRPNMEQIFKEAERRYEPKTTICGIHGDIRVVSGSPFWVDDEVWVNTGVGKYMRVYKNGVWAEILGYAPIVMKAEPKPEEKLIMATSKYNGDQYIFLNHKTMGLWYQSDYYIVMASLCVLRQNSFAPFGGDSYNFSEITLKELDIMLQPKGKYFDNNDETIKDLSEFNAQMSAESLFERRENIVENRDAKWLPNIAEVYFYIDFINDRVFRSTNNNNSQYLFYRKTNNIFQTQEIAQTYLEKVRSILKS